MASARENRQRRAAEERGALVYAAKAALYERTPAEIVRDLLDRYPDISPSVARSIADRADRAAQAGQSILSRRDLSGVDRRTIPRVPDQIGVWRYTVIWQMVDPRTGEPFYLSINVNSRTELTDTEILAIARRNAAALYPVEEYRGEGRTGPGTAALPEQILVTRRGS